MENYLHLALGQNMLSREKVTDHTVFDSLLSKHPHGTVNVIDRHAMKIKVLQKFHKLAQSGKLLPEVTFTGSFYLFLPETMENYVHIDKSSYF